MTRRFLHRPPSHFRRLNNNAPTVLPSVPSQPRFGAPAKQTIPGGGCYSFAAPYGGPVAHARIQAARPFLPVFDPVSPAKRTASRRRRNADGRALRSKARGIGAKFSRYRHRFPSGSEVRDPDRSRQSSPHAVSRAARSKATTGDPVADFCAATPTRVQIFRGTGEVLTQPVGLFGVARALSLVGSFSRDITPVSHRAERGLPAVFELNALTLITSGRFHLDTRRARPSTLTFQAHAGMKIAPVGAGCWSRPPVVHLPSSAGGHLSPAARRAAAVSAI